MPLPHCTPWLYNAAVITTQTTSPRAYSPSVDNLRNLLLIRSIALLRCSTNWALVRTPSDRGAFLAPTIRSVRASCHWRCGPLRSRTIGCAMARRLAILVPQRGV